MTWERLYGYQREGVEKLWEILRERGAALLADPPGAGKTAMGTHVALAVEARRVLVVAPASLRENWARELARWSEGYYGSPVVLESGKDAPKVQGAGVVVTSFSLASQGPVADALQRERWDLLIVDESHALKSASSQAARAILVSLWARCRYRLLMTGTPIPNGRASEAWTTFSRLCPEKFGSWESFKGRYCIEEQTPWGPKFTRSRNLPELRELSRPFMVRRPKEVILGELPPLVSSTVPVRVPELEVFQATEGLDIASIVAAVEAGVPLESDAISTARRKLGALKVPGALGIVETLMDEGCKDGGGVVVFVHHREVYQGLWEGLEAKGLRVVGINGTMPLEERQRAVDAFQRGEADVFLGSLRAAGVGITLTRSSVVVMVEADWVPSVNEQAEARIHRLTQTEVCRVMYLVVPDSLDEMVLRVVRRKQRDIERVMAA